jgi:hypothetical protein
LVDGCELLAGGRKAGIDLLLEPIHAIPEGVSIGHGLSLPSGRDDDSIVGPILPWQRPCHAESFGI